MPNQFSRSHQAGSLRIQLAIAFFVAIAVFGLAFFPSLLFDAGEPAAEVDQNRPASAAGGQTDDQSPAKEFEETFAGDGLTDSFRLSPPDQPAEVTGVEVWVDGQPAGFELEGLAVTLAEAPAAGQDVLIAYDVVARAGTELAAEPAAPPESATAEPAGQDVQLEVEPELVILPSRPSAAPPSHVHTPTVVPPEATIEPVNDEPVNGEDPDEQYPGISQEVKDLAADLRLSPRAKRLLYEHDPQIFDSPEDPGYICGGGQDSIVIYGCWKIGQNGRRDIHLIRSASMHTTLAHELLHAIYYEAALRDELEGLHALLDRAEESHAEEISEALRFYESQFTGEPAHDDFIKYSEMHSFIGSQFRDLPGDLEEHYREYFTDRHRVVQFYEDWLNSSTAKTEENRRIQQLFDEQQQYYLDCVRDQRADSRDLDCQQYFPEFEEYQTYNECLIDDLTTMAECRLIKPVSRPYPPQS